MIWLCKNCGYRLTLPGDCDFVVDHLNTDQILMREERTYQSVLYQWTKINCTLQFGLISLKEHFPIKSLSEYNICMANIYDYIAFSICANTSSTVGISSIGMAQGTFSSVPNDKSSFQILGRFLIKLERLSIEKNKRNHVINFRITLSGTSLRIRFIICLNFFNRFCQHWIWWHRVPVRIVGGHDKHT